MTSEISITLQLPVLLCFSPDSRLASENGVYHDELLRGVRLIICRSVLSVRDYGLRHQVRSSSTRNRSGRFSRVLAGWCPDAAKSGYRHGIAIRLLH